MIQVRVLEFKVTEYKDGAVYRAAFIRDVWINLGDPLPVADGYTYTPASVEPITRRVS